MKSNCCDVRDYEYLSELLLNNFSGLDWWWLSKKWKRIRCMEVAKQIYALAKEKGGVMEEVEKELSELKKAVKWLDWSYGCEDCSGVEIHCEIWRDGKNEEVFTPERKRYAEMILKVLQQNFNSHQVEK